VLRAYPGVAGRWRLASALIAGRLDGSASLWRLGEHIPALPLRSKDGVTVRLQPDRGYLELYLFGTYEPANARAFSRLVRPGDTIVDVGANVGYFAALLARWVGASGRVIAFEPVPHLADAARQTIADNGVEDVVCLQRRAVGAAPGHIAVHTFRGLPLGHASTTTLGRADAVAHECELTTLDVALGDELGVERVDFVKIDVEGAERDVLAGATRLLARPDAPIVHFEVNRRCLEDRGLLAAQVVEPLRDAGYDELWRIGRAGRLQRLAFTDVTDEGADYLALASRSGRTVDGRRRGPAAAGRCDER